MLYLVGVLVGAAVANVGCGRHGEGGVCGCLFDEVLLVLGKLNVKLFNFLFECVCNRRIEHAMEFLNSCSSLSYCGITDVCMMTSQAPICMWISSRPQMHHHP